MRVVSSSVELAGSRVFQAGYEQSSRLKLWGGQRSGLSQEGQAPVAVSQNQPQALLDSLTIGNSVPDNEKALAVSTPASENEGLPLADEDKIKITLVETMIEILTGKKIKIRVPRLDPHKAGELKAQVKELPAQAAQPAKAGWGLEYDFHEEYFEHEATSFSANGKIKTADGKEIDFSVDLRMSRTFIQTQDVHIRGGDARIDPLVINFNGSPARLTNNKFSFDLDSDGREDQISFLESGSGFLALDRNEDGKINNGAELFGPNTGQGFAELALFDEDGSGWIDEGDSIFSKLRIWSKDADGQDILMALGEAGVGAIYLGHAQTEFGLKTETNQSLGQVRQSGVFLKENGTAGTVQQIDLTV